MTVAKGPDATAGSRFMRFIICGIRTERNVAVDNSRSHGKTDNNTPRIVEPQNIEMSKSNYDNPAGDGYQKSYSQLS
jgi:hypothetical protein